MLNLLDGYRLRLPIKGGFTYAAWTKIFITSNQISEPYSMASIEHKAAFDRRISLRLRKFVDSDPDFPSLIRWSDFEPVPVVGHHPIAGASVINTSE